MRWNVLSKWSDGLDEMRHEARQVPSWLIFDVSQKMNASEEECLGQDDVRLFHKGACHVFAAALADAVPGEGYTLKRVVLRKEFDTKEAYHVFAAADGFLVDASGIKRAEDFVAWLTARHREKSFDCIVVPTVELHDVTSEELLAHHDDHPHLGSVNRWSLFVGPAFVAAARARATALIEHWPERYQVSVLKTGLSFLPK